MKYYSYYSYHEDKEEIVTVSSAEILEQYWDYWCEQMKKVGKESMIHPQTCIEDFCVIHWAWEVDD